MAIAVGDKLTGAMKIILADKSFFLADVQMVVTGAGQDVEVPGAVEASEAHAAAGHATGAHAAKK